MKVLAKFYGRVNKWNPPPEPSYVTLKDLSTNLVYESDAVSEKLLAAGIDHDDCEFEVEVQEGDDGKTTAVMHKLEPKKLTKEDVEEIKNTFIGRWPNLEGSGDGI